MESQTPDTATTEVASDPMQGIDPIFTQVVKDHGRDMFVFLMQAGMAQIGFERLAAQAHKPASKGGAHAVGVCAKAFNELANALAVAKGWTPEELALAERKIQQVMSQQIVVAESPILLQ